MATKNSALRDKMADDWASLWNSGTLVLKAGSTVVATFTLAVDAFDNAASGAVALAGVPLTAVAAASGVVDTAELLSSGSTYQITGLSVGEAATQVVVDNTDINSGQTVTLNSLTFTVSASTN
jgi:hypothetical protein